MSMRVLGTPEARDAIQQMKSIIENQLMGAIDDLNRRGQNTLSDPNKWDGPRAVQFRNEDWPHMYQALKQAKDAVEELRRQADEITDAIIRAGG